MKKIICSILTICAFQISNAQNFGPITGSVSDVKGTPGEPVQLQAYGGTSYLWVPSDGLSNDSIANPFATVSVTTTYTLNYTLPNDTTVYQSTETIHINDSPFGMEEFCPNLIINGDFEVYQFPQPNCYSAGLADNWQNGGYCNSSPCVSPAQPTTTDYFSVQAAINAAANNNFPNPCSFGAPNTGMGIRTPHSGNSFVGLINWSRCVPSGNGWDNWYEYLQQQLPCPLIGGQRYNVGFWAAYAAGSAYSCADIGMLVSSGIPAPDAITSQITNSPTVNGTTGSNANWNLISGNYMANGNERYVTIGNFTPTTCTYSFNNAPSIIGEYNFVDDAFINPIPPDLSSSTSTTVCLGFSNTTFSLIETGSPAQSCSWTGPNGYTATGGTVTVTVPPIQGDYTYTCTVNLNTCLTCTSTVLSNTIVIHVSNFIPGGPNLTVTSTPTVCAHSATGTGTVNVHVSGATPGTTYLWAPTGINGINPLDNSGTVYQTPGVYTYSVTTSGCTGLGATTFTVNPFPIFNVTTTSPVICSGQSATLTATNSSYIYSWTPSNSLSASTGSMVVANPTATTVNGTTIHYTATTNNIFGCVASNTVAITTALTPTVLITKVTTGGFCSNNHSTYTLTANGIGSGTGGTDTWNPSGITATSITVNPTSTTVYTLTETSALGCTSQGITTLTVNPTPTVSIAASSTSICTGSSPTLTASTVPTSTATTYVWSNWNVTANPYTPPHFGPNVTNYIYTVTAHENGCTGTATISVHFNPLPPKPAFGDSICSGTTSVLTVTNTTAGETYSWAAPAGGSVSCNNPSTCNSETINNAIAGGVYSVTATDANGCVSPTATIVPKNSPNVVISPTSFGIDCINDPRTYTLTCTINPGNLATNTYNWSTSATTRTITVTPGLASTIYSVTGTSGITGCANTATVQINLTANPVITASASPVCIGASATLTASSNSPNTGYTWSGNGANVSNHNLDPFYTPIITAATTQLTYTVSAFAGGCPSNTVTITLTPSPRPVITAMAAPANICQGSSSTLSASGAVTYTWSPATTLSSNTGTPVIATPTVSTTYTVQGTDANGCQSLLVYDNVNVTPSPTLSITAPNYTICQGSSVNLTAHGSTNYTWTPDPSLSATTGSVVTASPTVTMVYTVAATSTVGCNSVGTITIMVTPAPSLSITAAANPICSGTNTTLTAGGANTYTWTSGPGLGINASNNHSVTVTTPSLTNSVTYTLTGTGTGNCKASTVLTITVSPPPTVTISIDPVGGNCATSTVVCAGDPVTLTANSNTATDYTWTPGGSNDDPVTVTPSNIGNNIYTVIASDGACVSTTTTNVVVTDCNAGLHLPPKHGTTTAGMTYEIPANTNFILNGNLSISSSMISIAPNATITVIAPYSLTIDNSHLYATSNSMWQGIVVQQGATINVINNSLIEDAIVAIDNNPASTIQTGAPSKINVNGAVFNCNRTSVRQAFYQDPNNAAYSPTYFSVNNAVVTCRCGISYPVTLSTLNTYVGNTASPDLTDYYSVANFTDAGLKYPYAGQAAFEGVHFENNGVQGTNGSTLPLPFMYTIGNLGGSNLVLFDNLTYGVNAINATFSVTASAFQMPKLAGAGGFFNPLSVGGYGVLANVTTPDWYNGIYIDNSRFIRMIRGIQNINYYDIELNNNIMFSRQTIPTLPGISFVPPEGGYGMYSKSVRFQQANMNNNTIVNINNGIDFVIDQASYNGGNGEYVGNISANSNNFDKQFTNSYSNSYAGNAIVIDNVITPTATTTTGPGVGTGTKILVQNNTINNVFRGILVRNQEYQEVRDENNSITMLLEPPVLSNAPTTQYGIQHAKTGATPPPGFSTIYNNNVTGFTTNFTSPSSFEPKKAIWVNQTRYHYVTCNNVVNAGRGFEFTGAHVKLIWRLNNITNCGEGLALTSATGGANMGPQGQPNDASDNQWSGSGLGDTYVDLTSNANNSPLYVQNLSGYVPLSNITAGGPPYVLPLGSSSDLFNAGAPSSTYNCSSVIVGRQINKNARNSQNNNSVHSTRSDINLLEQIAQDSLQYVNDSAQNDFINKNMVYHSLAQDNTLMDSSVVLQNFYTANQTTYRHTYCVIEDSLRTGNHMYAASLVSALAPSCLIEQNYQRFYQIYINNKLGVSTASDTMDLESLAGSCPLLNGMVVLQARSFHNSMYNDFKHYEDNCPQSMVDNNRLSKDQNALPVNKSASLYVYPNPGTGRVYISGFDGNQKTALIEITDVTGKLIYKQQNNLSNGMVELNLQFGNGLYFIHALNSAGVMQIQKLVINN